MLSKTALNAIKAFAILAELPPGAHAGTKAVAKEIGAGQNYLGKLLQSLVDEGLVHSQKGLGGGFRLTRAPDEISLYDVVEPIIRVSQWEGCFMGNGECSSEQSCAVHDRWETVRTQYLAFLKETTIYDLAQDKRLHITVGP